MCARSKAGRGGEKGGGSRFSPWWSVCPLVRCSLPNLHSFPIHGTPSSSPSPVHLSIDRD
ncbi:hypothetical protein AG1IA_07921 [Rhizoctonia solani AG-1 IA]|uniref:Uncharacterized protein n=1 Tax=Thanatephorus cucumeris (strain AG1-IA) TaxID=983506 RepID=L8WNX0_THACA|nr:hypothetical protein AG1IA_07921 [Rhizoctonia solani AG-1 IA]